MSELESKLVWAVEKALSLWDRGEDRQVGAVLAWANMQIERQKIDIIDDKGNEKSIIVSDGLAALLNGQI